MKQEELRSQKSQKNSESSKNSKTQKKPKIHKKDYLEDSSHLGDSANSSRKLISTTRNPINPRSRRLLSSSRRLLDSPGTSNFSDQSLKRSAFNNNSKVLRISQKKFQEDEEGKELGKEEIEKKKSSGEGRVDSGEVG